MTIMLVTVQLAVVAAVGWLLWSSRHDVELEADGRWWMSEEGVVVDVTIFNPGYTAARDLVVTVTQGRHHDGPELTTVHAPDSVLPRDRALLRITAAGEPEGPALVHMTWRDGLRRRRRRELDLDRLPWEANRGAPLSDHGPS